MILAKCWFIEMSINDGPVVVSNKRRAIVFSNARQLHGIISMTRTDTQDHKELGILVGNTLAFSDSILRHTSAEFTCLSFIRISTIDELLDITADQAKRCSIIVVEEGQVDGLMTDVSSLYAHFKKARFALAYRRKATAQAFLRHATNDPALARIGILPMRLEIDHWLSVLRLLMGGERYIPYDLFDRDQSTEPQHEPVEKPVPTKPRKKLPQLTDREIQVLTSVSEGKQNKIIAAELDLSEHTVKLHIHNVISKLGVNNRTEAAIRFLADGPKQNDRLQ